MQRIMFERLIRSCRSSPICFARAYAFRRMSVWGVVTPVLYATVVQPTGSPVYVKVMEELEQPEWMERARCRRPGVDRTHWITGIDKTKRSKKIRELALAECSLCPAQWECIEFAIRTLDDWNICAAEVEDRRFLASHDNWVELLDMAHESRMAVFTLIRHLRRSATT